MNKKTIEEITVEFFKEIAPHKSIKEEKSYGYFDEWMDRFKTDNPEPSMDILSLAIWRQMQKEFMEV